MVYFSGGPELEIAIAALSTKPDQFRKTFNPELDVANSLAVKSSDHNWLLRRNLRFSGACSPISIAACQAAVSPPGWRSLPDLCFFSISTKNTRMAEIPMMMG